LLNYVSDEMGKEEWRELASFETERAHKRLKMPFEKRALCTEQPLSKDLLRAMEKKETNLVVAADNLKFESAQDVLKFADELAPDILALKFHPRVFEKKFGWLHLNHDKELLDRAKEGEYFVINDTKIDDIGKIAFEQAYVEMDNAHMVTALTAAGGLTLEAINDAAKKLYDIDKIPRGSIPMLYMTPEGHCFDKLFDDAIDHANMYGAVGGVVAGRSLEALEHAMGRLELGILIFSPGIKIKGERGERGQTYGHPFHAVTHGTDITIVGSGIYGADNPIEAAIKYKEQGWEGYLARLK